MDVLLVIGCGFVGGFVGGFILGCLATHHVLERQKAKRRRADLAAVLMSEAVKQYRYELRRRMLDDLYEGGPVPGESLYDALTRIRRAREMDPKAALDEVERLLSDGERQ